MPEPIDPRLLVQAKNGEEAALAALIAHFMPAIRSMARGAARPGLDFEDAVQEGYIGLFQALRTYRSQQGAGFDTYAKVCIRNAVLSAVRQAERKKNAPLNRSLELDAAVQEAGPQTDPEATAILKEEYNETVSDINTKLSGFEKEALLLSLDGKSYGEIASALSKSPKAVDNALVRVRRKLRRRP